MPPPSGIVVYPADGWNSFGSQADIDAWIDIYTPNPEWTNLSPEQKQAYTLQAAFYIKNCPTIVLPETPEDDLVTAQAVIAYYAYKRGEFIHDPNSKSITKEKVGELEVQYDAKYRKEIVDIPPNAYVLLAQYGCKKPNSSGFSQTYAGRS